jgi:hypothetical protein
VTRLGAGLIGLLICLAAGSPAGARPDAGSSVRPCTLLVSGLATELAPGVRGGPTTNTAFDCAYSDRRPTAKSRWQVSLSIPFRPPTLSATKAWAIYRDSLTSGGFEGARGSLSRSRSGADRGVWTVTSSDTSVAGPSMTVQIAWLKGQTFGVLHVFTPKSDSPTVNECQRVLRQLLRTVR